MVSTGEVRGVQGSSGEYRGVGGQVLCFQAGQAVVTLSLEGKYFGERCKIFITFLALVLKYFPNV